MTRAFSILAAFLLAAFAFAGNASAQHPLLTQQPSTQPAPATQAPSPNDIRELMRLLSDERMVNWLKTQSAADDAGASGAVSDDATLRQSLDTGLARIRARLLALVAAWDKLDDVPEIIADAWQSEMSPGETLRTLNYILIFLFVGAGLEWLYRQYTLPTIIRLEFDKPDSLWKRFAAAALRLLLIAGGLAIFSIGSIGAFLLFDWEPFVQFIVLSLLIAVIAVRTISAIAIFVLAPKVSDLRLIPLRSRTAKQIYHTVLLIASLSILGIMVAGVLDDIAARFDEAHEARSAALAVSVFIALLVAAALVILIWRLTAAIQGAGDIDQGPQPGKMWPIALTCLVVICFLLWLVAAREVMWSVAIIGLLIPALIALRKLIDHLFDRAEGLEVEADSDDAIDDDAPADDVVPQAIVSEALAEEPPSEAPGEGEAETVPVAVSRYGSYRPVVQRLARFVLVVTAILLLVAGWGTNLLELSASSSFAGRAARVAVDIAVALLIADLIWIWAKSAIDKRMADYKPPEPGHAPGPEARMATLLPLLRKVLMVTVLVMVGLSILSSIGINVAPLLAGAGVVGLAIGFGAQALIKDVVSGVFYLIDDAFRIGEYIEIDNLRGTVESISVRSLRLRHHRGAVHTIPFGEMKSLTNYSRDWVIMKMEFRVPFETDLKLVKKIVKRVGAELEANEEYGSSLLQPLKSQGVRRMEEFNMVVGVKFMAKPGEQWVIRRDAFQKIRDAFDEHGISFAQRNVKVEVLGAENMTEGVKNAAVAAAQDAIEQQAPPGPAPDEP